MNYYMIWCNLKESHKDLEFSQSVDRYLTHLKKSHLIESFRFARRKLGFGPEALGEFQIVIETNDMAALDQVFDHVARRTGDLESLHANVYSRVTDFKSALYRDFPDPQRGLDELRTEATRPAGKHFYDLLPDRLRTVDVRNAIEIYADQGHSIFQAVEGLTAEQMQARPIPGTWSIHEILVHLLDSDLFASERMKRILAEDRPSLYPYDESAFAKQLDYHRLDWKVAIDLFSLNRQWTAHILRHASDADFHRVGIHMECGEVSLATLIRCYVHHVEHHLEFVRKKRALVSNHPVRTS